MRSSRNKVSAPIGQSREARFSIEGNSVSGSAQRFRETIREDSNELDDVCFYLRPLVEPRVFNAGAGVAATTGIKKLHDPVGRPGHRTLYAKQTSSRDDRIQRGQDPSLHSRRDLSRGDG